MRQCLSVKKGDCCILELQMKSEDMYGRLHEAILDLSAIIVARKDALMGDVQVAPRKAPSPSAVACTIGASTPSRRAFRKDLRRKCTLGQGKSDEAQVE